MTFWGVGVQECKEMPAPKMTIENVNTVNFRFMEVRFKEVFRFKQELYFPKMKK